MGKRNSAEVLASSPSGMPRGEKSKTVEVRPIANGFIRRESEWGDGEYKSSEVFHKDNPGTGDMQRDVVPRSSLKDAISSLKGK